MLKRPEGKTLEFKRDLSSPDRALKTIVAFANTAGGATASTSNPCPGSTQKPSTSEPLPSRLPRFASSPLVTSRRCDCSRTTRAAKSPPWVG